MFFVAGVVLWVLGATLVILASQKQIAANPGRRIAHFYGRNHAAPAQARWLRAGGMAALMLSTLLLIQISGLAALISMAMGFMPGIVSIMQHNHGLQG